MSYYMETAKDGKLELIDFQMAAYVEASGKYNAAVLNTITIYFLR